MRRFKLRCPKCGYTYYIQNHKYEWETCPICGHGASFDDFVVGLEEK